MDKKTMEEGLIKASFIASAIELLKKDGVQALSARSIAEKAGYSFSTFNQYYSEVKELFFYCVREIENECRNKVQASAKNVPRGSKKIKAIVTAYAAYLVQYPHLFSLFFLEKPSTFEANQGSAVLVVSFLDRLCEEEWEYCIQKMKYNGKQAYQLRQDLKCTITGLLLLHLNRNYLQTHKEFEKAVKKQIDRILLTK